ncbi:MAG: phosphonoacetaldehyde hydrolase [Candidatus Ornithomonoglobus sp.]
MSKTEMIIFDWAGTTVDYGCFAPVNSFLEAFREFGLEPTIEEIRKPMGMLKIDHIRTMLEMNRIKSLWQEKYNRTYTQDDVQGIYKAFEKNLLSGLDKFSAPKEYVTETIEKLRGMGIKIGSTTGYTEKMMDIVKASAMRQGYAPDVCITPEKAGGYGRPYPYMIFENMRACGITSVKNVIKVGDTLSDIREGVNAGVYSVGVIDGSSEMGFTKEEFEAFDSDEKAEIREMVRQRFFDAGADFVIENIRQVTDIPVFE